ncbi:MAG: haloacid dehalogenase-like hydrolase [Kofleriaceae bacterium]
MPSAIYLFDIDGTLLRAGGAGSRAFDEVMREQHAIDNASAGTAFGGKTDPWIIDDIFRRHLGRPARAAERAAFLERYLPLLDAELERRPLRVLPSVASTLATLGASAALGVATGNVEPAAAIKLRHAGLSAHFRFGGYGSDSHDRAELVAVAIARARAFAAATTPVVVVGDTVHDIAAARACDVEVCAVATGGAPREALGAADAVFDSMHELVAWHQRRFAA